MPFVKGKSGNPKGRPPGIVNQAKLRESIAKNIPEILAAMVEQAKAGDTQAARLLLDRTLPAIKPTDTPVVLPLAGADLGADGRAVIAATGQGDISPDQAKTLLSGLGTLARITEVDELVRRIEALEKSIHAETKN
jgi:hypothetical protein